MREALKNRVVVTERPQIAETPGERAMPGGRLIAVSRIHPNPKQPRKHFDPASLAELADSMRERGVMQPLVVRPVGGEYEIVMGERRYRAALLAGLDELPVVVREIADDQAYLDALIENLQRADLTDEEEAAAYRGLRAQGLSVRQIAGKLGVAPSKVSRVARIYDDPVLAPAVIAGRITKSEAQELLGVSLEEKTRLVGVIADERGEHGTAPRITVRQAATRGKRSVALRNTPTSLAKNDEKSVALRNTALSADTPDFQDPRIRAQTLRQMIEEQIVLLGSALDDPIVAANLERARDILTRATRRARDDDRHPYRDT